MPKLFDLLSERSDKDALKKLRETAPRKPQRERPEISKSPRSRTASQETAGTTRKVFIPDYVAIDLETTGLDSKADRIIEVGAIRFVKGVAAEEYHSLVNPGRPIPPKITDLTGIRDDTVAGAPPFHAIADKLLEFISYLYLCGQQIEFDYGFLNAELKRAGKAGVKNLTLDTAVLSRLVLTGLPGYSLANICRHMGIAQNREHRALDDARACGEVAARLIEKLDQIPVRTRMIMGAFAPPSMLKTIFVKTAGVMNELPVLAPVFKDATSGQKRTLPEDPVPVTRESILRCFSDGGDLSRTMAGYVHRPSQAQMALHVADALNSGTLLAAEAGTGTGKSMAYLAPAAQWAISNNARVIVSTHTKNLQDQLISKDLPPIRDIVGKEFRYSALKGRSNYLCVNRWNRFLSGELGAISHKERMGILPLIQWAEETDTGDVEGQNRFNRRWFGRIWSFICADMHGCLGRHCPRFNACFLQRARQKALGAHIVVINHALFFSDICAESSFLGSVGPIVFDEAHHLESCGHRYLRVEIDTNRMNRYLDAVNNLLRALENDAALAAQATLVKKYKNIVRRQRKESDRLLADIGDWASKQVSATPSDDNTDLYAFACREKPFEGLSSLAGFRLINKEMLDILFSLQAFCHEEKLDNPRLHSDISSCMDKTSQLKADLSYCTNAVTDDHVFWVEGDRKKNWVKLCGVPLDVGEQLNAVWRSNRHAAVFTSATLTVAGSFEYFRRNTGLDGGIDERTSFKTFSSPFHAGQMLRCAVQSPLLPDAPGYNDYVAGVICRLVSMFDKNILVLFTANAMLYGVHDAIKNNAGFPADAGCFVQGISGTRATVLDKFKASKKSVLLGTASFWEGIDAPGDACEMVVMPRLPFTVPTHPLTQALAARAQQKHGGSFFGFSVPEAVIRFRQGAGRLIRTANDRGALIVLDGRMAAKSYGRYFMDSLEGEFLRCADVDAMIRCAAAFFNDGRA